MQVAPQLEPYEQRGHLARCSTHGIALLCRPSRATEGSEGVELGLLYPGQHHSRKFDITGTYIYFSLPPHSPGMMGHSLLSSRAQPLLFSDNRLGYYRSLAWLIAFSAVLNGYVTYVMIVK